MGSRKGTGPLGAALASSGDERDTIRMLTFGAAAHLPAPVSASSAVTSRAFIVAASIILIPSPNCHVTSGDKIAKK